MGIPVFYSAKMNTDFSSFSPSAGKPAQVVEAWQKLGVPMTLIEPAPVSVNQLKLVHCPRYVEQILSCEIKNGFGNTLPSVAATLPYTTGAMLSAARHAILHQTVAVSPCSGFHHAGYASGFGYCTFNGLMVTALALQAEGLANRIGILDFDMHYGDGTDALIEHHQAASWIEHYSAGRDYLHPSQGAEFMARIQEWVSCMHDCDVILYQAGADPHIHDPLGGLLNTAQLRERDRHVFTLAKSMGVPIVWNLAGGYQVDLDGGIQAVLDIHNNTMLECVDVFGS